MFYMFVAAFNLLYFTCVDSYWLVSDSDVHCFSDRIF